MITPDPTPTPTSRIEGAFDDEYFDPTYFDASEQTFFPAGAPAVAVIAED